MWIFWITLAIRFLAAVLLPMTGDEAYYVSWGKSPALGYYDQPPMVGWWMAALLGISDSIWWVRLPAVLTPAAIALLLRRWPKVGSKQSAALAAASDLYLLIGALVFFPFITTDTPLVLFSFLAVYYWAKGRPGWAGIGLGCAFLSKYFAAFLLPAFAFSLWREKRWRDGLYLLPGMAAALALHFYWNSQNCYANFVFNFWVRHGEEHWNLRRAQEFGWSLAYLLAAPVLAWFLSRHKRASRRKNEIGYQDAAAFAWIPLSILVALSFRIGIGFHFSLAFIPFAYLTAARLIAALSARSITVLRGVALVLFVAQGLGLLYLWKLHDWNQHLNAGWHRGFQQTIQMPQVAKLFSEAAAEISRRSNRPLYWYADAYTQAALLGFHSHQQVAVLSGGSQFGRQSDFSVDWLSRSGSDGILFFQYPNPPDHLKKYFDEVRAENVVWNKLQFWVVELRGFKPDLFVRGEIVPQLEKFYRRSEVARRWGGACPLDHYLSTLR